MEIKASLDPGNRYLLSWTEDGDPCGGAFVGVACNANRKVSNISLQGKRLTGKLSPAVAELKCLSGLYLHYNSLTGEIPNEIANLTELTDLYLNINNLSGSIPSQIGSMASLQVLHLCCNRLTGGIPKEIGLLKRLSVLALDNNLLSGQIPASLGDIGMLKRLYLSFNGLSGPIPVHLANLASLQVLEVQNNTLSGVVPSVLMKMKEGFHFDNNPGLCGAGFPSLRACTHWDNANAYQVDPNSSSSNGTVAAPNVPRAAMVPVHCTQSNCLRSSSKLPRAAIVAGVVVLTVSLMIVMFVCIVWYRRGKQKVRNRSEVSDERLSIDLQSKDFRRSPSPLVALEYSERWDPMDAGLGFSGLNYKTVKGSKFNLEEIESATQHFSEVNLLGKSKFSAVYRGILKDGSVVAIKSINKISCRADEDEIIKGLNLLNSLKHENLVSLKGFCYSKARSECFLVYDFASNGNLSEYLDLRDEIRSFLNWSTRVSVIHGIAKGIEYLHSTGLDKPPIIHQNISVEKVLLNRHFRPLIVDSGLLKLLADDVVYSALKVSAALGYMAPEYITTGRFTEKSDVYAFGVIILQVLSGRRRLSRSIRTAAEAGKVEELVDSRLHAQLSDAEAALLIKIALDCTLECPDSRPSIASIVQELDELIVGKI